MDKAHAERRNDLVARILGIGIFFSVLGIGSCVLQNRNSENAATPVASPTPASSPTPAPYQGSQFHDPNKMYDGGFRRSPLMPTPESTPQIWVDPNKHKSNSEQTVDRAPLIDPNHGTYLFRLPGMPFAVRLPEHLYAIMTTYASPELPEPMIARASNLEVEVDRA